MLDPLQVVRYHPGEKYEPHHDSFDLCDFPQKPRRHLTFLIYLNDLPLSAGGATTFPRLKLSIQPEKHMALVFNDVLDNGLDDERTEHSGTPPVKQDAVKYAINWCGTARPCPPTRQPSCTGRAWLTGAAFSSGSYPILIRTCPPCSAPLLRSWIRARPEPNANDGLGLFGL